MNATAKNKKAQSKLRKPVKREGIEKQEAKPARAHLSDWEKETIIGYNETTEQADIFTYSQKLIKHLKTKMKLKPYADNGVGGLSFKIDKDRLRFPQPKRAMSEKAKKAGAERLAKGRARKQGVGKG